MSKRIDFHCHLLPNLDDGPTSMDEVIEMAAGLQKAGFTTIYCTPHLIKGSYDADKEAVMASLAALKKTLKEENIGLELVPGREYYLDEFLFDYLQDPLPLGETRIIMIELPNQVPDDLVRSTCYRIKLSGYTPMIAHPERNELFALYEKKQSWFSRRRTLKGERRFSQLRAVNVERRTPSAGLVEYLQDIGCAFQGNLCSFSGLYSKPVRRTAEQLRKNGFYTHYGTDLHSPEELAYMSKI